MWLVDFPPASLCRWLQHMVQTKSIYVCVDWGVLLAVAVTGPELAASCEKRQWEEHRMLQRWCFAHPDDACL